MPKISIIVPVYNAEAYLSRCIDSILAQSLTDYELILIDDGSPDRCGAICDEYAQKDPRIHVIHQKNGGLSAARNTGIDWSFFNSSSQWLTFIDSDDWIHPDFLSTLLRATTETKLSLSICSFVRTSGNEPSIPVEQLNSTVWCPEDYFVKHNINATIACGKLYRKDLFQKIRYPVGKIHEDEFTTYQILFSVDKVAIVSAPLYYYYYNNTGITHSAWNPKRLDAMIALSSQLEYYYKNGFHKACIWQVSDLIDHILWQKRQIDKLPKTDRKQYYTLLRKHLRKALRIGRKTRQTPFLGNEYLYGLAYPFSIRMYAYAESILKKIKGNS